jgi:hypothetical protein
MLLTVRHTKVGRGKLGATKVQTSVIPSGSVVGYLEKDKIVPGGKDENYE